MTGALVLKIERAETAGRISPPDQSRLIIQQVEVQVHQALSENRDKAKLIFFLIHIRKINLSTRELHFVRHRLTEILPTLSYVFVKFPSWQHYQSGYDGNKT